MKKRESEARGKIIEAATALITELGSAENVTTRNIAVRAGVGVGLVNYHFQSKENLVSLCAKRIFGNFISEVQAQTETLRTEPIDKLRFLLKSTARFLSRNSGISRTSIMGDLLCAKEGDNTSKMLDAYFPAIREVCAGKATETEMSVQLHLVLSALQAAFLRGEAFGDFSGIDFNSDTQRDQLVDVLLYIIFRKYM